MIIYTVNINKALKLNYLEKLLKKKSNKHTILAKYHVEIYIVGK